VENLKAFLGGRVVVKVGDITKEDVDAIVNAANGSLMGGGGVDGAIHRAGGREIKAECEEIRRTRFPGGLPTGAAVLTAAGKMTARYVIHTVGPFYGKGGMEKSELLARCYRNSLTVAVEAAIRTIAFPAISTGIYGYPPDQAARVSSEATELFLKSDTSISEVRLVFFSPREAETFLASQIFTS
jgi:O-acetyl-ADP-ribose deacetylase (regulator of RNase III)